MRKELIALLAKIEDLRNQERLLIENFESSTGELSKVFHYIIESALEDRGSCCLTIDTCPTHLAETLRKMDFYVVEEFNCFDVLCGYRIYLEELGNDTFDV